MRRGIKDVILAILRNNVVYYALTRLVERLLLLVAFTAFLWFIVLGIPQLVGINPATYFISPQAFTHTKNPEEAFHLQLEILTRVFGFNQPLYVQFFTYLKNMFTLNLGYDVIAQRPVSDILLSALPYTAILTIPPLIFQTILAIYLGSLAAIKKGTWVDNLISNYMIIQYNIPVFFVTLVLWVLFAVVLKVYPLTDTPYVTQWQNVLLDLKIYSIPWLIQTLVYGFPTRGLLMRNTMIDVLDSDFIKYERLVGLRERIIRAHARRVSIIPVAVRTAIDLAFVLSGDVFLEIFFGIPGLGYILYYAALGQDFQLILGATFALTLYAVIILYAVDILQLIIDPRVRKVVR